MADRICQRGWLVSPSPTDGKYVPFFVRVRDKDINWDSENIPEAMREIASYGSNIDLQYPMYQYIFDVNDWSVKLSQNYSYEATKKLDIKNLGEFVSQYMINVNTDLPFITQNDSDFSVQATLNGSNTDVICSTVNIKPSIEETVDSLTVQLINRLTQFSSSFTNEEEYDNQFIYVTVRGNLYFE
jgi:hypothetical protein